MGNGAAHVFEGSCNGAFGHGAKHLAVVGEDLVGTMRLVDCSTGGAVHTFTPTPLPSGGGGGAAPRLHHSMRYADVCFSPGDGGLLLWGNLLWDVRLPHPVGHRIPLTPRYLQSFIQPWKPKNPDQDPAPFQTLLYMSTTHSPRLAAAPFLPLPRPLPPPPSSPPPPPTVSSRCTWYTLRRPPPRCSASTGSATGAARASTPPATRW